MWTPPLLLLPLIIYNVVAFGLFGIAPAWTAPVFTIDMVSGAQWSLTSGDLLLLSALVLLFIEVIKSTRTHLHSIMDHGFSTLVFALYLIEFLIIPAAATSLFFGCLVMSLIDLIAGFIISIRAAGRDVNIS